MAASSSAAEHPLQGGPSYRYSYQEMDPTELQYLHEQQQQLYLQESHQQLYPGGSAAISYGQSGFQAGQSFTQSYLQRYHHGRGGFPDLGESFNSMHEVDENF